MCTRTKLKEQFIGFKLNSESIALTAVLSLCEQVGVSNRKIESAYARTALPKAECLSELIPLETCTPTTWRAEAKLNVGFNHLIMPKASYPISVSLSFWLAGQREYWRGLWPSSLTAVGMSPFIWKFCPFKSCHSVQRCATNALHFLRCLSLLLERFIYVPLCVPAAADKQQITLPLSDLSCL